MAGEFWTDDAEGIAVDAITGRGGSVPRWLIPCISTLEASDNPTAANVYSARLDASNFVAFKISGTSPDSAMTAPGTSGSSSNVSEMLTPDLADMASQRTVGHYALVTTTDNAMPVVPNFTNVDKVLLAAPVSTAAVVDNGGKWRIAAGGFTVSCV